MEGLEPPRLTAPDPKSGAATNYATSACVLSVTRQPAQYTTVRSGANLFQLLDFESYVRNVILLSSPPVLTNTMRLTLLAALVLAPLVFFAQGHAGSRSAALAGSSVTFADEWSALNNQAGMAFTQYIRAAAFYESRFLVQQLGDKGFAASAPIGAGAVGLSYRSFGYSLFSDSRAGLAYAIRLDSKVALGVQANYHRLRIAEGYGSSQAVSIEGGVVYRMTQELTIAAHLFNPTRAKIADFNDERIPGILRAGAAYALSDRVKMLGEIRKRSDLKPSLSAGIEYYPADEVAIRVGAGANPGTTTFGIGWQIADWRIDAATSYHAVLGFSPQISLAFAPVSERK